MKKIIFALIIVFSVWGLLFLVFDTKPAQSTQYSTFCVDPAIWECCFDGESLIGCCRWEAPVIAYRIDDRGNYIKMGCFRNADDCERANVGRCAYCDECPEE